MLVLAGRLHVAAIETVIARQISGSPEIGN
jgi:hypothetical protein